jgi:hypothetical protein
LSAGQSGYTDEEGIDVAFEIKNTNGPEATPEEAVFISSERVTQPSDPGSAHEEGKEGIEVDTVSGREQELRRRLCLLAIGPGDQGHRVPAEVSGWCRFLTMRLYCSDSRRKLRGLLSPPSPSYSSLSCPTCHE